MRMKSSFPFIHLTVICFVFLFSVDVLAQVENNLTKANECRHVAVLPRHGKIEPYTARCFIPSETIYGSNFSLLRLVDKEWDWVYKHDGTVSGQVIVRGVNSVSIFSQKMCIDRGKTIGSPYRQYYDKIGNGAEYNYTVGENKTHPSTGDAYAQCINSPTQWHDFRILGKTPGPLPDDTIQYVRLNIDAHFGNGTKLIPFNFSYTQETLDDTFRSTIEDGLKGVYFKLPSLYQGKPIVITEYPFEIGLSVLGSPTAGSEKTGDLVKNITHDFSVIGWERILQARSALTGRSNSAEEFPENISRAELISFTVLTFLSIALYWQELRSCAKERAEEISTWNESTGSWLCVTAEESYRYINVTRMGTVRAVVSLVTSMVSIVASVLIFHDSSLRYQKILRVAQGGVITYGKTLNYTTTDPTNDFAGSEFSVGHWMEAHIEISGTRGLFTAVFVIAVILSMGLVRMTFLFTLLREHHLDHWFVRAFVFPLKWTILFFQTLFARLLPARWNMISSYEVSFQKLCRDLTIHPKQQPVNLEKMPNRTIWRVHHRYKLERFSPNQEADDLEGEPQNNGIFDMNKVMKTPTVDRRITRNEIEKAAEILAANAFRMLSSIQAITLMYGHNLSAAADRYAEKGLLPSVAEVRGLARIWYIEEMVLLSQETEGNSPDNPQRVDMENDSQGDPPLYTNEFTNFSPVIWYRPSPLIESSQLNDGVAYVTYAARTRTQEQ